ncbi:aldo/keto reductase [Raoultibacter phocaeensis]|uniref:aldo/keto reductase n=1 Tax=Raoultibacter phocaeensis TaxID=2479841 RepID=UPI00111AE4C7|nr:aldo/keto reductase [Raoultibacter phocaeensis]
MEKRVLGRTGIEVGVVGIGGEGFENKPYDACEALIDRAIAGGANFIDIYNSNPDVRTNVGRALVRYPRESFVVEGHIGSAWKDGQYYRTRDIEVCRSSFEDFLSRMQLGFVDIGMIHYVDEPADFDAVFGGPVLAYAQELKESGIIGCIGMSTHNTEMALRAVGTGLIDVMLFSINPAYDMLPATEDVNSFFAEGTYDRDLTGIDPQREELYRRCETEGVALTVMKALGAGMLLDGERSPFGQAMTPVQCIHYCLTRPAVASVPVGLSTLEEMDAALTYAKATDAERDYSAIIAGGPRTSIEGSCMYCGHCAPCTSGIDIAQVNKFVDLALPQEVVPDTLRDHYALLDHTASECIECGACESNCPFGVSIVEKMHTAVDLFEKASA